MQSGPLPHDVYVWQRAWTPEVRAGLVTAKDSLNTFVVFSGQLTLGADKPKVVKPVIDYKALRNLQRPIALAIRVDPFSGPFSASDGSPRAIVELVQERVADARRHGVEPTELHFDFDCAESKLERYRVWLTAVREAIKPLPVRPTVLPSWLKHGAFAVMAKECGGYILQVHCVSPPRTMAETKRLTDPADARGWVEKAGKIGVPFRVALPTYTYLVAFDADGKPRGVSAEAPSSSWSHNFTVVRWEAEPDEIAGLIAEWTRRRPLAMTGIIWYRLPVAADSLNWRWPTLQAVMAGRAPVRKLRLEATADQPSELVVINDGERDEPLPVQIEARWEEGEFVAADALAGYAFERTASHLVFRRMPRADLSRLSPGTRRPIGWIRCDKPTRIRLVEVPADRSARGDELVQPKARPGDGY
jgi:hypothetical protein